MNWQNWDWNPKILAPEATHLTVEHFLHQKNSNADWVDFGVEAHKRGFPRNYHVQSKTEILFRLWLELKFQKIKEVPVLSHFCSLFSKYQTSFYMLSFNNLWNPHSTMRWVLPLSSFHSWRLKATERTSNLPKTTQLEWEDFNQSRFIPHVWVYTHYVIQPN